jgi:hypothetical protein
MRAPARDDSPVARRPAQLQLSIEVDSDPIAGSLSVGPGVPQPFTGWIELVELIEEARSSGDGSGETLGWLPGAESKQL